MLVSSKLTKIAILLFENNRSKNSDRIIRVRPILYKDV